MTVGTTGATNPPTIGFNIVDGGYFGNNSVNLIFNCLKIY